MLHKSWFISTLQQTSGFFTRSSMELLRMEDSRNKPERYFSFAEDFDNFGEELDRLLPSDIMSPCTALIICLQCLIDISFGIEHLLALVLYIVPWPCTSCVKLTTKTLIATHFTLLFLFDYVGYMLAKRMK